MNTKPLLAFTLSTLFATTFCHAVPADLDDDGIPNNTETTAGLDPNNPADALLDLDNDGWINLDEFRFDTDINDNQVNPGNPEHFPRQAVFAADAEGDDEFGFSVAIDGNTAIIGAQQKDGAQNLMGAAYVFVKSGDYWVQQQKLTASNGVQGQRFGQSVAISGDTIIIGAASGADSSMRSAYVFVRNNGLWSEQAILQWSTGWGAQFFGISVDIDGDTAAIGSDDIADGKRSGTVHMFTRNGSTWTFQERVIPPTPQAGEKFGHSLSLDGDTLLVGAYQNDDQDTNAGTAYVYTRSGSAWSLQQQIFSSDSETNGDHFGFSVALSGNTAIIGAYRDDPASNPDQGSAFVYTRTGNSWALQQKLAASNAGTDNSQFFGYAVGLDGDRAIVGATNIDNDFTPRRGAAYVFERTNNSWTEEHIMYSANDTVIPDSNGDEFASAVAISGSQLIVGDRSENDAMGTNNGSALFADTEITSPTPSTVSSLQVPAPIWSYLVMFALIAYIARSTKE